METNQIMSYMTELHPVTVTKAQYATSLDKRGFIPVYEYEINGESILWDRETGYVFLTGIWKSLGHTKVDVIKTVRANPGLQTKRIRGGLLKIQGTWIPYQDARSLCLRVAWNIRQQLIPLFGASIVEDCLPPHHPNYRVVCVDYLQSSSGHLSNNSIYTKKRRHIIKAPSGSSPSYSSPPLPQPSSIPTTSSPYTSSPFPMAISYILNNDNGDSDDISTEYIDLTSDCGGLVDDGVVPGGYENFVTGSNTSSTLAFQVVPTHYSLLDGPSSELTLSPLANDWSTLDDNDSSFFDDFTGVGTWDENEVQESIETIRATIILQGLSHQDRLINRETVPDKVMVNGREFLVLWD